nr:MAG TPA: hypothetical protein [Caudoviricetes sp.]
MKTPEEIKHLAQTDEDAIWLCKHNLKELGIDLDALKGPFYGKLEVDIK